MSTQTKVMDSVFDQLSKILGNENLLTDDQSRSLYAQDVFTKQLPALAVARPLTVEQLAETLKVASQNDIIVVPRGGGMSYTSGYVPTTTETLIIDLGLMNKVVEINRDDMYVTVEAGCTWKKLHEALKGSGLRTPFWGTLSGLKATIGGGLSQNSIFWGSGQFGSAADSVVSLEVVLGDGSIVNTGSDAQINGSPFFRHYGPDLTGLFTSDTGALGFKAKVTLRLIPELPAKGFLAFDFKSAEHSIAAMSDIARSGFAMECFGFDPFLQSQRMKRESLGKDVKALAGVMKSSGSFMGALKDGAKVALAGRGYMKNVDFSIQVIVEDYTSSGVDARLKAIRDIAAKHNGREIENSIPKITRANPFGPVNNMLGPVGERWVPIHGLFPHSKAEQAYQSTVALFDKHRETLDKYKIGTGHLFALVGFSCFVLEPVFFWPDAYTEIHAHSVEKDHLAKLTKFPENLPAREAVAKIRAELGDLYREIGGVHLQIGKSYKYKDGLKPQSYAVLETIKNALDPHGRVNPQSLGLK